MSSTSERWGAWGLRWAGYVAGLWRLLVRAVAAGLDPGPAWPLIRANTVRQVLFTGVEATWVVAALAALIGGLVIVQTLGFMGVAGEQALGTVLELVVIRELGPVMTALIVIGRSGSSITVELGGMRVLGEMELLEAIGVDPARYLILPRMVGVTVAVVGLFVIFDLSALLGGYLVAAAAFDTPFTTFLLLVGQRLSLVDVLGGLIKATVFGLVIAAVSTWQGLSVGGAITEVPQRTLRSVVHSIVAVVALDVLLTLVLYSGTFG